MCIFKIRTPQLREPILWGSWVSRVCLRRGQIWGLAPFLTPEDFIVVRGQDSWHRSQVISTSIHSSHRWSPYGSALFPSQTISGRFNACLCLLAVLKLLRFGYCIGGMKANNSSCQHLSRFGSRRNQSVRPPTYWNVHKLTLNSRVCEVHLLGDGEFTLKQQKYRVSEALKTGEASALFGQLILVIPNWTISEVKFQQIT